MSELAHIRSKDTLVSTFSVNVIELLTEAGAGLITEAGVELLAEPTSSWIISLAHAKSGGMIHVRYSEAYNAPLLDFLTTEAGVILSTEAGVEILSENLLTPYTIDPCVVRKEQGESGLVRL